jgi:plastocyanin
MRKILLFLVASALLVAGAATAKTVTVTITKAGYNPSAVTVAQGDVVQFTNSDTVAHQVVFKSTVGVTCTPNPVVLAAGQSGTCSFQTAGSYSYSDPTAKGKSFKGTVTVTTAAEALTLTAAPRGVTFGASSTLSGVLSTHKVGEKISVLAQQCGASAPAQAVTVDTTTNGAYSAVVKPLMNTAYTVKLRNTSSSPVTVTVRPALRLVKVAAHRYSLRVTAATSFAGKYAGFQRFNGTRWVAVKVVALHASSAGVAPSVVTTATFRSSLKAKLRVRAVLGRAQVGSCYLAGTSNTILS